MKNINKHGYLISIASLVVLVIGGALGYFLKGQYEANELRSSTKLKDSELQLLSVNKSIQNLELSVKEHRDRIDIQGKQIQNEINKLDLEIRSIKNTLEITSRKLGISSDVLLLLNDIVPKADLKYDISESGQLKNQPANKIVHYISNAGKYPFYVTGYKIFVTKNPINDETDAKDKLIEGSDYTIKEDRFFEGFLSPGISKPYSLTIFFPEGASKKYRQIYVTYFVYYKTQQSLVENMKRYSRDLFNEKEIASMASGKTRSETSINFTSRE